MVENIAQCYLQVQSPRRVWALRCVSGVPFLLMTSVIYFSFFQEVIGVFAQLLGVTLLPKVVVLVKYVAILALFGAFLSRIVRDRYFHCTFMFFSIVVVFTVILASSSGGFYEFLAKTAICLMAFFVGKHIRLGDHTDDSLDSLFFWLSFLAIISGLFDYGYVYMVTNDSLLRELKIGEYFGKTKEMVIIRGLPGNLYGSFGESWFSVRRLGGLFWSPLTYAYFAVILLYYQLERRRWTLVIPLLGAISLTLTRAIIIPLYMTITYHLLREARPTSRLLAVFVLGAGSVLFVLVCHHQVSAFLDMRLFDSSGMVHVSALSSLVKADMVNFDLQIIGLSEGVWSTVIKLGWIFAIAFCAMLFPMFKAAAARRYLMYSWITYLFSSFLSPLLFSPTSVLVFWFVLGTANSNMRVRVIEVKPNGSD